MAEPGQPKSYYILTIHLQAMHASYWAMPAQTV